MADWRTVPADLHVHTVVSACAETEMIPPLIVRRARELGLELLGITDHHSVENALAVQKAACPYGIRVLPGMEVQTREEVHVLCLFDDLDRAESWQEMIWRHLPAGENQEEHFGAQYVVSAEGDYLRTNKRLLQTSTILSFEQVLGLTEEWGGLALPAHVDRPRYSLFANLGMIPEGVALMGAEISSRTTEEEVLSRFPSLKGVSLVQSGDAHRLEEMSHATRLRVPEPTFRELRRALLREGGREVILHGP
jgi:PHP family Zn ribbon phosphoesterase